MLADPFSLAVTERDVDLATYRHAFQRFLTQETSCNNGMVAMFMPSRVGTGISPDSINSNGFNATLAQTVTQAAINNMKKCLVVDLFHDLHDKGPTSSIILARYFPWMQPPKELPKLRQRRLAYYKFQPSHLRQIEDLNALDAVIYSAALKHMRQQQLTLQSDQHP